MKPDCWPDSLPPTFSRSTMTAGANCRMTQGSRAEGSDCMASLPMFAPTVVFLVSTAGVWATTVTCSSSVPSSNTRLISTVTPTATMMPVFGHFLKPVKLGRQLVVIGRIQGRESKCALRARDRRQRSEDVRGDRDGNARKRGLLRVCNFSVDRSRSYLRCRERNREQQHGKNNQAFSHIPSLFWMKFRTPEPRIAPAILNKSKCLAILTSFFWQFFT